MRGVGGVVVGGVGGGGVRGGGGEKRNERQHREETGGETGLGGRDSDQRKPSDQERHDAPNG